MSTAASSARRELWPWIGHNAWWLNFSVNAILVATIFWSPPAWTLALTVGLMVFFAVMQHRHNRSLCEQCISNMPLDPQTEIVKRDRWLRAYHFGEGAGVKRNLLVVFIIFALYIVTIWFAPKPVSSIAVVLFIGLIGPLYTIHAQIHKRLQPWCPYCHRDDGDDYQFDPNPTPELSKELT